MQNRRTLIQNPLICSQLRCHVWNLLLFGMMIAKIQFDLTLPEALNSSTHTVLPASM
jgi:hypothetical protein